MNAPAGPPETPEERIALWVERDAAIGLHAEVEQLRARLSEREREVADVRERSANLAQRVTALTLERDALARRLEAAQRAPLPHRAYRRVRSIAARVLPR